jgi:ketosteroid isomerase-like protein
MSEENVEIVRRGFEAGNRRDIEAMIEVLDPEVEWHSALLMSLEGEAAVYRRHEGIREFFRDLDGLFDKLHAEYPEIRDLGDRVVAIGRISTRGKGSGAETESQIGTVVDLKNGKAVRVRTYLDPKEALEAAGLRE